VRIPVTGVQEMIGICSILSGDPNVDPVKYLNRAFEHYSKLRGRAGRMLATRVMMDAAAYMAATGRCADVSVTCHLIVLTCHPTVM